MRRFLEKIKHAVLGVFGIKRKPDSSFMIPKGHSVFEFDPKEMTMKFLLKQNPNHTEGDRKALFIKSGNIAVISLNVKTAIKKVRKTLKKSGYGPEIYKRHIITTV